MKPQTQNPQASHRLQDIAAEFEQLALDMKRAVHAADPARLQALAKQVQGQLFLAASQLLPLWRDQASRHGSNSAAVDRAEVRLDQLRNLVAQVLQHGPQHVLQSARCAVLADELHRQQPRALTALAAMDRLLDRETLRALTAVWKSEARRLQQEAAQGDAQPVMDNEDADPVGQPPR